MEKEREKSKGPRTRTRQTDFHKIENPSQNTELSGYELEVREKLAEGLSPLDQMIQEEKEFEKKKAEIQIRRRVLRNRKYAGLTAKQWECLKLRYQRYSRDPDEKEVPLTRIAQRLGIRVSSTSSRLKRALRKIENLTLRQLEGQRIKKLITKPLYRAKLRNVSHLYFERLLPPKKIAKVLHRSLASIYKNIRILRWLAHSDSPKEAALPEVYQFEDDQNQPKKIVVSVKKPYLNALAAFIWSSHWYQEINGLLEKNAPLSRKDKQQIIELKKVLDQIMNKMVELAETKVAEEVSTALNQEQWKIARRYLPVATQRFLEFSAEFITVAMSLHALLLARRDTNGFHPKYSEDLALSGVFANQNVQEDGQINIPNRSEMRKQTKAFEGTENYLKEIEVRRKEGALQVGGRGLISFAQLAKETQAFLTYQKRVLSSSLQTDLYFRLPPRAEVRVGIKGGVSDGDAFLQRRQSPLPSQTASQRLSKVLRPNLSSWRRPLSEPKGPTHQGAKKDTPAKENKQVKPPSQQESQHHRGQDDVGAVDQNPFSQVDLSLVQQGEASSNSTSILAATQGGVNKNMQFKFAVKSIPVPRRASSRAEVRSERAKDTAFVEAIQKLTLDVPADVQALHALGFLTEQISIVKRTNS